MVVRVPGHGEALEARRGFAYPRLASVRFSHVWRGRFAAIFDWLPHMGTHEGIQNLHALVGAGVPACGYLGHELAQRILSRPNRDTVFTDRHCPQRFGYHGSIRLLPLVSRARPAGGGSAALNEQMKRPQERTPEKARNDPVGKRRGATPKRARWEDQEAAVS